MRGRLIGAVLLALTAPVSASSLDLSPVLIEVVARANGATSLTLRNRAAAPARLQVRVFRWRQANGSDVLEPANDVAASPPFVTVAPGAPYVVRVVRTSVRPVAAEESYRLLIDELPEPGRSDGNVQFAMRHSLPVFFRAPEVGGADVAWTATRNGSEVRLTAVNRGDRRLRISNLRLVGSDGPPLPFGTGLAGYAL